MPVAALFFYLFAILTIVSGFMVISVRNPVHAVLFLILAFFNAAGLFILLGAEFLAMILVIVYVGAVAVLFLFVVMMLDVNFDELRAGFSRYLPVGAAVGIVLLSELIILAGSWTLLPASAVKLMSPTPAGVSNADAIGRVLYTDYVYYFELAGLVLLVAMIGAIVLTLRHRENVKRQDVSVQTGRRRDESIELVHVETGKGLN
jgi:NADH-quinone oxidoreductase subunit J